MTNWRLREFVHEESSRTLANLDVVAPLAGIASPVVTHLARHGAFVHGRVLALHPSGRVCPAAVLLGSGNRYVWTGCTIESVPSILKAVPLITSGRTAWVTLQPGRVVQRFVWRTFRGRYRAQSAPEKSASINSELNNVSQSPPGICFLWESKRSGSFH